MTNRTPLELLANIDRIASYLDGYAQGEITDGLPMSIRIIANYVTRMLTFAQEFIDDTGAVDVPLVESITPMMPGPHAIACDGRIRPDVFRTQIGMVRQIVQTIEAMIEHAEIRTWERECQNPPTDSPYDGR
jgi:hypothetical protein